MRFFKKTKEQLDQEERIAKLNEVASMYKAFGALLEIPEVKAFGALLEIPEVKEMMIKWRVNKKVETKTEPKA